MGERVQDFESLAKMLNEEEKIEEKIEEKSINEIEISKLIPFENHPFKLYKGERYEDMVQSIKELGVIVPIVVQQLGDVYQILSGHNRVNAAKAVGLTKVPAVVKENLTEEEAMLIVTETNLMQRSFTDLTHSERAAVISARHRAMKCQGIRTDILNDIERMVKGDELEVEGTSCQIGKKLDVREDLVKEYKISPRNISRYLRIDRLKHQIKELLDEGKIPMNGGVELSYLSNDNQDIVASIMLENNLKIDVKKAETCKIYGKNGKLTWDTAKAIITGDINKKPKSKAIKLQSKIITKYFRPEQKKKEIEETIETALEFYFQYQKGQEVVGGSNEESGSN